MPKGPIIQDRSKREIVIAIAMGLLLIVSIGSAWLITRAALV